MIKELTTYIETQIASLTIDSNLFAGFRPDAAPDECVVVLETNGGSPNSYFPDAGEKPVQVLSRATSYWTARANSYLVHNLLKSKAQLTLPTISGNPNYKAEFIEAQEFPQSLDQDDRGLWEFSQNFIVRIREI